MTKRLPLTRDAASPIRVRPVGITRSSDSLGPCASFRFPGLLSIRHSVEEKDTRMTPPVLVDDRTFNIGAAQQIVEQVTR